MYLNVFSIIRRKTKRFRPLIRGFFFIRMYSEEAQVGEVRFRPLIRGFFFYST